MKEYEHPKQPNYKLMIICGREISCNFCGQTQVMPDRQKTLFVNSFIFKHKKCKPDGQENK